MPVSTARTASYKGRTYRLLFLGETKFGRRAKLGFLDGSKEFWVAASLVSEVGSSGSRRGSYAPRVSAGHWECPACEEENPESASSCWECGCGRRC